MSKLLQRALTLVAGFGVLSLGASSAAGQILDRIQLGANYNYVDSNAPPNLCGCFSLNGGSGWFGYKLDHGLTVVAEVGGGHASNINRTTTDLTLTSYLFGARYSRRRGDRLVPFAQLLLGDAHGSGGLTPVASGLAGSANSFAMAVGGGMDIIVTHNFGFRPFETDYYLTRFTNGGNDHQNNFRLETGVVFYFGRKH
jgi:outer membrane immunogenic protein